MKTIVVLSLVLFAGCGDVTEVPTTTGDAAAAADVGGPSADVGRPAPDVGRPSADAGAGPELAAVCHAADRCGECADATATGGTPFASATQCRTVVECVQAGAAGAYPWQSCFNTAGGGPQNYGGLSCAQAIVKACP